MLFSLVLSMATTMFAVEIKAADTSNANAIDNCVTRKFLPYDAETAATYLSGENTYPKLEGHVFAGWYTDDVCSKENLLNDKEPSGTVYALFVPEHVLSVQAQVSAHIVDNSVTTADETASIRFVTTVDSLLYKKVGFEVSYTDGNGNVKTATSASTKVYDKLYITGTTANKDNTWQVTPAESFCGLSKYFKACTVTNVPVTDYAIEFTIRPFWITMDGAKVYGVTATKTVEDGCLRDDVYVSDNGVDVPYYGTADKPYKTMAYAIQHVNDNKRVHIADTYTIASDANWPSHEKKVTVTGGTLDFSAKSRIYIKGDVTFTNMNLTLSDKTNTAIFAEGHKLVVKENVNFTNEAAVKNGTVRVEIVGGSSTKDVASTDMKLYAGSYNIIYGGAIDHKVTGDTNVVVGKKVNSGAKYTDHDSKYLLFGGSCEATVSGDTNVTVEEGATFNYVYGGGYLENSNVEGATNVTFSGSAMSIYGGSYAGTNSDTNIVMNGGIAEQVLGGSASASMTGNTNVQILGGTVTRRVYGGCYNELSNSGQWANTNYQVTGHTNVSISPKATLSLNHSDKDNSIYAISRSSDAYDNEWGTFIFNQASYDEVYNTKLGYNDYIYESKFSALTHHYLVTTNGNNADDLYGNVSPQGEWLHIQPKKDYVATVTIGDSVKYYTEGEGYYPLPELTSKSSQTDIKVTFSEKASTVPVVGDTEVAIIKITDCENGTVTSSKEYCVVNGTEAITLTVTPDEGYNLTELSVKKDGEAATLNKEITLNGGEYSFIPQAGTYTVEATFTAKEYGAIGGTISGATSGTITATNTTIGEVYTFSDALYEDGSYGISVPVGTYQLSVDGGAKVGAVAGVTVTKDQVTVQNIVLKNKVHDTSFELTSEGYYKSKKNEGHNYFVDGWGSQWVAELTLPELSNGNIAGFTLHKRATGVKWYQNWLRIGVKNVDGAYKLYVKMNVDGDTTLQAQKEYAISDTSVKGKTFQVLLLDGELIASLDGKVIQKFTSSTTFADGKGNLGDVLGTFGTGEIYCGLFAGHVGTVIEDWNFDKISNPTEKHTVSGNVLVNYSAANLADAKITFTNKTYTTKTYTTSVKGDGSYSIQVPSGDYKVTVSYSTYFVDNTFECSVLSENVTKDFTLRKHQIYGNASEQYYKVTEEGYLKSVQEKENPLFQSASATQWIADMELPNLEKNQNVGFVLIKKADKVIWKNWMRILVKKADDGTIKLFTKLNINDQYEESKEIDLATTSTEGKVLQVALINKKILVLLNDSVIAEYDSNSAMIDGSTHTVKETFGTLGNAVIYCGPYASTGIIIKDWNFSDVIDTTKTYTVSGKVSASLASANVADADITFENKADDSKVYKTKPNAEGSYSIQVPTGDYKVTVSYSAYYVDHTFDCRVVFSDVTQDISLTKNKVHNEGTSFQVTEDGNYQSILNDYSHNRFNGGYGSAWVARLELPDMADGKGVGFVLHQSENNKIVWSKWMRIVVKKTSGEAIELYTQMKVDGSFDEATTIYVPETYAEGKTLQVALINSNIIVTLDGTVIATYDSSSKLKADSNNTVGAVFGDLTEAYCGLLANDSGIVIKDWSFNNVLDASKEYTVSGTVSARLEVANVSEATLTFANKADESKVYTVKPNAQGKYSVQVPSGDYKVTLSYAAYYEDNIFNCRVVHSDVTQDFSFRKNKLNNSTFVVTKDGYYKRNEDGNNKFQYGHGSTWIAELELPNLENDQGVGFVLAKRNTGGNEWGRWMRIMVKKTSGETIELYTHVNVNKELNGGSKYETITTADVPQTYAAGKTLQISFVNGKITLTLDGVVIAQYDKNTKLDASHTKTVGDVFGGDMSLMNCGLYASASGITIQDWNFSNVSNAGNDSSEALLAALGGKTLSVLGDSISTWGGVSNNTAYNTTIGTNNPYYNGGNMTALTALNQTYWGSVMEKYHMSLCVNNSFSSGRLVDDWIATSNGVHIPSALTRCTELGNKNGITPDVIAIYIGTNDFKTAKTEGVHTTAEEFGTAYQTMLDSISAKYSGAKVFCFTLIPNNQRTDQTEWNAYNDKIRTVVANNSFATLVDIAQNSGIDWNNYTKYTVDGVHPNLAGMKKIADVFEAALSAAYVQ